MKNDNPCGEIPFIDGTTKFCGVVQTWIDFCADEEAWAFAGCAAARMGWIVLTVFVVYWGYEVDVRIDDESSFGDDRLLLLSANNSTDGASPSRTIFCRDRGLR